MQAITVKRIPMTNSRPMKYKAQCVAKTIYVPEPMGNENGYHHAAAELVRAMKWDVQKDAKWIEGGLANGDVVFVLVDPARSFEVLNVAMPESIDVTRVDNDSNGNPRYVVHFLNLLTREEVDTQARCITSKYETALANARKIGGRKFHNKQYGGGIVFQCYGASDLIPHINRVTGRNFKA